MSRGLHKIESEVFHFPKAEPNGLSDFYKPHAAVDHPAGGSSLTRQDMAEECDINVIMSKYENTGVLPAVVGDPFYADFTSVPMDMQGAMEQLRLAQDAFMTLPARVRREFDNDPAVFVDFASKGENLDTLREWGLAKPKPPEPPSGAPGGPAGGPAPAPASPGASAPAAAPGAAPHS